MRNLRTTTWALSAAAAIGFATLQTAPLAADPAPEAPSVAATDRQADSAVRLFAAVEEAWVASSAERLAALVDTTVVRIALKPGTPPTSAVTRGAAAFLFQDQLRLVTTASFRVVKIEVSKKGTARADAEWSGDWGGRQGTREVKVSLNAAISGNRWLLTEVRSND